MVWHLLTSLPFPSLRPKGRNSTKLLLPEGRGMGQAPSTAALCFSVPESWGHRGQMLRQGHFSETEEFSPYKNLTPDTTNH